MELKYGVIEQLQSSEICHRFDMGTKQALNCALKFSIKEKKALNNRLLQGYKVVGPGAIRPKPRKISNLYLEQPGHDRLFIIYIYIYMM